MTRPERDTSTREDIGMLAVLEAIAETEDLTQRELSRLTGLNLKKVNYCLHKLLDKGHIKFQRAINSPDKRAYLYIMTPSGLKEKSRLTYRFLKFTLQYYSRVEQKLARCLRAMGEAGVERVVLLGASDAARIVMGLVQGNGIEVVGVLDCDSEEREFGGVPIVDENGLDDLEWDGMLITALDGLDAVDRQIVELGLLESKVWRLT